MYIVIGYRNNAMIVFCYCIQACFDAVILDLCTFINKSDRGIGIIIYGLFEKDA